ncbi:zinc knuckle CX2CX4HX4C containing protein [Tanacetum coccineum]
MGKKGAGVNNGGRKLKSINDSAGNVIIVSRSSVDGAANGTIIGEAGKPFMVHKKVTCDNVADFFGVSLTSIKYIDDFNRRMEAGDCEDVLGGLNKDEQNAIMDAIMDLCGKFLDATSDNVYSPKGITNDGPTHSLIEWNTSTPLGISLEPIQSLLEKFSADMSNSADNSFGKDQPDDIGYVPNPDMPIIQSVFILKPILNAGAAGASFVVPKKGRANFRPLESENVCDGVDLTISIKGKYGLTILMMNSKKFFFFKFKSRIWLEDVFENGSWMIRNSQLILKKWTMNTKLFKEELTHIPMWIKLHDVPIHVFLEDGISLIATQIGKLIMLVSFTSSMCTDSWGRSIFARCLIEVKADAALKDNVTMGIPLPDDEGFTKETVQVDGAAAGKATWQPIKQKVSYELKAHGNLPKNGAPKISISAKNDPSKKLHATKGGFHVPTSKPSVPTSNLYDVLDDMGSEEEAKVV